jgi:N utilization substance protein A
MEKTSIMSAIKQVCTEKGLSVESVIDTIESAMAAAYRKDFGNKLQNIKVKFNTETGEISRVYDIKTVVLDLPEEDKDKIVIEDDFKKGDKEVEVDGETKIRFNPRTEIQLSEAKELKKSAKVGDEIITELELPDAFGRMAAQTAKQVIIQKLREAERVNVFEDFKNKVGTIMNGVVQRRDPQKILVDFGKTTAVLPREEQIRTERFNPGDNIKVLVKAVNQTIKGPEIILSRADSEIVKQLFALEIPEIESGSVVIKSIAREAGFRSKVAVMATEENIDPIGSCVGQRGARIQTIIGELGGEKVDIIEYDEDPGVYIANALSPAKVISIEVNEKEQTAVVTVKEDQFSLAIGKEGQNVRLAVKLTGWKINIKGSDGEVVASVGNEESEEEI